MQLLARVRQVVFAAALGSSSVACAPPVKVESPPALAPAAADTILACLRTECSAGRSASCDAVSAMLLESGRALSSYETACSLADAEACDSGGSVARSLDRSDIRGRSSTTRACALGKQGACASLEMLRWHGRGTARDEATAIRHVEALCDQRAVKLACGYLGQLYAAGRSVPRDEAPAIELLAGRMHPSRPILLRRVGHPPGSVGSPQAGLERIGEYCVLNSEPAARATCVARHADRGRGSRAVDWIEAN